MNTPYYLFSPPDTESIREQFKRFGELLHRSGGAFGFAISSDTPNMFYTPEQLDRRNWPMSAALLVALALFVVLVLILVWTGSCILRRFSGLR